MQATTEAQALRDPLPTGVVCVVAAHEDTFLDYAVDVNTWGGIEMSDWARENVTHIAFYRPYRHAGAAITHVAEVGQIVEEGTYLSSSLHPRVYWDIDFAGPLRPLPVAIPFLGMDIDPRGGVRGRVYVTLESLLTASHTGQLTSATERKPTREDSSIASLVSRLRGRII